MDSHPLAGRQPNYLWTDALGPVIKGPVAELRKPLFRNSTSSSFTTSLAVRSTSTLESLDLVVMLPGPPVEG